MKHLAVFLALAAPAQAQDILSPSEFEAFVNQSTVYFTRRDLPYGAEQYLRNRKVIWQFSDGTCEFGEWFPSGDQLCFLYEHQTDALCWHYIQTDAGKGVRIVGDDPTNDLIVAAQDSKPLECAAPNVGASYKP